MRRNKTREIFSKYVQIYMYRYFTSIVSFTIRNGNDNIVQIAVFSFTVQQRFIFYKINVK